MITIKRELLTFFFNTKCQGPLNITKTPRHLTQVNSTRQASADSYLITPRPCDVKRHCTGLF